QPGHAPAAAVAAALPVGDDLPEPAAEQLGLRRHRVRASARPAGAASACRRREARSTPAATASWRFIDALAPSHGALASKMVRLHHWPVTKACTSCWKWWTPFSRRTEK